MKPSIVKKIPIADTYLKKISAVINGWDDYWIAQNNHEKLPKGIQTLQKILSTKNCSLKTLAAKAKKLLSNKPEPCLNNLYQMIVDAQKELDAEEKSGQEKSAQRIHKLASLTKAQQHYAELKNNGRKLAEAVNPQEKATLLKARGLLYLDSGEIHYHGAALQAFSEAIQLKTDAQVTAFCLRKRGYLYLQASKVDEALHDFSEACRQDVGNAQAWFEYGEALVDAEQPKKAIKPLEKALSLNPHHQLAQILLSKVTGISLANTEEAESHLENVSEASVPVIALLQSLQNKLEREKQNSISSLDHTSTDIKVIVDATVQQLQENQKEGEALGKTSQALEVQSVHLEQTLQQEIEAQKSERCDLEQQQTGLKQQIADLEQSLTKALDNEKQKMERDLKTLKKQLRAVQDKQVILLNEQQTKIRKREALHRFQSDPNLLLFYRTVYIKLEEIFISFKAVASGFVKPVPGNLSIAKSIFDVLGDAASIAPIVGKTVEEVLKWSISAGLEKLTPRARQKNRAINASELSILSDFKKYAESIARQLTERYEEQLCLLMTPEEEQAETNKLKQGLVKLQQVRLKSAATPAAKQFATFGVLWIMDELYNTENIDASKELDAALLSVICQKVPPGKLKRCWQEVTKALHIDGIQTKSGETWHPEVVYTLPGVKTKSGEYYSSERLDPDTYGWRLGTIEEAANLELTRVVLSEQPHASESQKTVRFVVKNPAKETKDKGEQYGAGLEKAEERLERIQKTLNTLDVEGLEAENQGLKQRIEQLEKNREDIKQRLEKLEQAFRVASVDRCHEREESSTVIHQYQLQVQSLRGDTAAPVAKVSTMNLNQSGFK